MEQDLIDALLAFPGLAALVDVRIDWNQRAPGAPLPALVLSKVGGGPSYDMDGQDGLGDYRVQIDCLGETFPDATDVKDQVVLAIAAMRRPPVQAFVIGEIDELEPGDGPQGSGPTDTHQTSLDVRVWHTA